MKDDVCCSASCLEQVNIYQLVSAHVSLSLQFVYITKVPENAKNWACSTQIKQLAHA